LRSPTRPRAREGAGRYPQPVALLARLGVDVGHEGRGLGAGLFQDVVARTHALGEEIGCRGLLVHAETVEAREFYLHLVPEFEMSNRRASPVPADEGRSAEATDRYVVCAKFFRRRAGAGAAGSFP
jgi:GNAT superfamily N-acetyltransferase